MNNYQRYTSLVQKIKDKYSLSRGGRSRFYCIYCSNCGSFLCLYQKDGPGVLKRMYLDRILAPEQLTNLQSQDAVNNLICMHCQRLIAIPVNYDKEQRKSYGLLAYAIIKKSSKGVYPPEVLALRQ